jgi:calcineurin-like phosphoesterase family protein
MKVYFSSDTHYFHDNIIKYCSRPFRDSEEMNKKMIDNWNKIVSNDDVVFHVGDVSAGLKGRTAELRDVISSLRGKKILIRGNHDHLEDSWYLESGFLHVTNLLSVGNVILSHIPLQEVLREGTEEDKLHVVHGHVHRTDMPNFPRHFNVAVDRNDFRPVPLESAVPVELHNEFLEDLRRILHLP